MSKKQIAVIILLASFLGGMLSLFGYRLLAEDKTYQTIEGTQQVRFSNYLADTNIVVPEGLNFIYAADIVTPAVVHIKTLYEVKTSQNPYSGSPFEDMLREFYGDRFEMPERGMPNSPQEATGSGVILSEDGYIVTNNHVVEKADKIEVVLNDNRSYTATLIGTDPTTDLALLKIDGKGFPFVRFGNSNSVKIGEWVLAVGNPFNLTSTVTAGIVSAKARNINILHDKDNMAIESFIQTDAVVNPGNSGGALVNLKGELIGINTAIASPTGAYAGYSFAVPETLVKKVVEDLLKFGQVQRALLGVTILDLNANLAKEKGISDIRGVYISSVGEGSAAAKAGLKEGDVIIKIGDIPVNTSSKLQEVVATHRPGDKVVITYIRKGEQKTVEAMLKNKMGDTKLVAKDESVKSVLGAELAPASKSDLKKLNIESGVKVGKVSGGKFKETGIKEGFIITSIDKKKVSSPSEVEEILESTKNGGILIEGFYPNGQRAYYALGL